MGESLKGRLQQCTWCETLGGNRVKLFLKRFLKCKWALALITSLKVFATNGDLVFFQYFNLLFYVISYLATASLHSPSLFGFFLSIFLLGRGNFSTLVILVNQSANQTAKQSINTRQVLHLWDSLHQPLHPPTLHHSNHPTSIHNLKPN